MAPTDRAALDLEVCVSAAVRTEDGTVVRGRRHGDCLRRARSDRRRIEQGFVTSRGRFVSREEGLRLQLAAGIESVAPGGYRPPLLFSEDLY